MHLPLAPSEDKKTTEDDEICFDEKEKSKKASEQKPSTNQDFTILLVEDNDDDGNEVRRNDKGGLKIDKNKRGSRIIGDIHVKVLGKEDPVKMLIKSSGSRKGNKMADLLGEKERESYSVFASQKKRQRAGKFVQ